MTDTRYADVRTRLYDLPKFTGEMNLEPITAVMDRLGGPHTAYPAIHVAGTNGKGSTVTFTAAMLAAAGYRVGRFTSPHLTSVRERICIDGAPISEEDFITVFERVEATGVELSFFEYVTAMAFTYFAEQQVDIAVIETGLGGRLDATNILEPAVAVITNVDEDHQRWLGNDAATIAAEKAGIIKPGTPVISGADGPAQDVIEATAQERDAPLYRPAPRLQRVPVDRPELTVTDGRVSVRTRLCGDYQIQNMNMALTALEHVDGFEVSQAAIRSAIGRTVVPARMELVSERPRIILDGAHNPAGIATAAASIERMNPGRTIVLTSIMADKDYERMLETIAGYADEIVCSQATISRAADPEDLAAAVTEVPTHIEPDIKTALEHAIETATPEDTIVVTGSLYFLGDVRPMLERCL